MGLLKAQFSIPTKIVAIIPPNPMTSFISYCPPQLHLMLDVSINYTATTSKKQKHCNPKITVFLLARLARFERATYWFVARYSIQLSYRRMFCVLEYISTDWQKMQALFFISYNSYFPHFCTYWAKKGCDLSSASFLVQVYVSISKTAPVHSSAR